MPTLDAKQTYKNLKKKGFEDSANKSDDHKYLEFWHNGKLVLYTKISHGEKDLDDFLIGQMKKQCKLSKSDFMDLANCPLSQEDYTEKLRTQELLDIDADE
jgi:predicted RNA binding protein YcfA (HicA-like mRNA interferase family)